jgi:hypothetical protein
MERNVKMEAIIKNVQSGSERTVGKSLKTEFVYVRFRVPEFTEKQGQPRKVVIKNPEWLSELQPAAPVGGYLMEGGEFSAELESDPRLKEDLRVTVEVED